MAAGNASARSTLLQPSAEPPRDGLTIIGNPTWSPSAATSDCAPSSRKISWGRATCTGTRRPASATTVVAIDLSKATRQAEPTEPTNRTPSSASTSRSAPSSPASPCSTGNTTGFRSAARRGSSAESTSDSITSTPRPRNAWLTRRPERNDTSRSCDRPPARTTTVSEMASAVTSCSLSSGSCSGWMVRFREIGWLAGPGSGGSRSGRAHQAWLGPGASSGRSPCRDSLVRAPPKVASTPASYSITSPNLRVPSMIRAGVGKQYDSRM